MQRPPRGPSDLCVKATRVVDFGANVARLPRPESVPNATDPVEAIETHFAWMFLSTRLAYEVKNAAPARPGFRDARGAPPRGALIAHERRTRSR
jgi:aminoglycoside phosphotransferase family enzyme